MGGIFILAMECMNTAIERVVDDISKDKRDLAKQAKDTASAAVALCALGVGSAWIVIIFKMYTKIGASIFPYSKEESAEKFWRSPLFRTDARGCEE